MEETSPEKTALSIDELKGRIANKRGVFKWLPVYTENDKVHGSWWYVWASLLCVFVPVFPLISLYADWWAPAKDSSGNLLMPTTAHVAAYSLMIFSGIVYTIGSFVFINVFRDDYEEHKKNNDNILHSKSVFCRNDEFVGIWIFLIGTIPFIPVLAIYCYYNPGSGTFVLALILTIILCFAMLIYLLTVAPGLADTYMVRFMKFIDPCLQIIKDKDSDEVQIAVFVPCFAYCCPCLKKHFSTDFLILCWVVFIFCLCGLVMSVGLFAYSVRTKNGLDAYNYATAFFLVVLFTVGTMYLLAGSYPVDDENSSIKVSMSKIYKFESSTAESLNAHFSAPQPLAQANSTVSRSTIVPVAEESKGDIEATTSESRVIDEIEVVGIEGTVTE